MTGVVLLDNEGGKRLREVLSCECKNYLNIVQNISQKRVFHEGLEEHSFQQKFSEVLI